MFHTNLSLMYGKTLQNIFFAIPSLIKYQLSLFFGVLATLIPKTPQSRLVDYCLLSVRGGRLWGQLNKSTKLS